MNPLLGLTCLTEGSTNGLPFSSRYAPTPRLIFFESESALKASVTPGSAVHGGQHGATRRFGTTMMTSSLSATHRELDREDRQERQTRSRRVRASQRRRRCGGEQQQQQQSAGGESLRACWASDLGGKQNRGRLEVANKAASTLRVVPEQYWHYNIALMLLSAGLLLDGNADVHLLMLECNPRQSGLTLH